MTKKSQLLSFEHMREYKSFFKINPCTEKNPKEIKIIRQ